jgi:predicted ATP-grasp superfamily ATP-dependent carboligase
MSTNGALVLGGDYRGLGIVRSLGRRGVAVWVAQDDHWLAGWSRFTRRRLALPSVAEGIRGLLDLATRERLDGWAIFPTSDITAALIARNHSALSARFRLTTPPWEIFRWTYDKRLLYSLAERLGVDHPRTRVPTSRDEVLAMDCEFPVIVKPAFMAEMNRLTIAKAWPARDRATLIARYDEASQFVPPGHLLIQDFIPGGGEEQYSYATLCVGGEPRASLVARRLRQWPIEFGRSSSFVETVALPEVEAIARRVLSALALDGLVEIEFKRDPRDGRLKLLDVNARVWGWHTIGRAAGVDFPYLFWSALHGEAIGETRGRPGVRWVHAITDVPAAFAELRAGRLGVPKYIHGIFGGTEFAILSLDDPVPAILEIPMALSLLWRRKTATARQVVA